MPAEKAITKGRTRRLALAMQVLVAALCILAMHATASAQDRDLQNYLAEVRSKFNLPALAAAVVKDGTVVAAAATGTLLWGGGVPVNIDALSHTAPTPRAMPATLAGMLVEGGILAWDSRVGDVLGEDIKDMSPSLANATLEQLLSHASGIPSDTVDMLELYFSNAAFEENLVQQRLHILVRDIRAGRWFRGTHGSRQRRV